MRGVTVSPRSGIGPPPAGRASCVRAPGARGRNRRGASEGRPALTLAVGPRGVPRSARVGGCPGAHESGGVPGRTRKAVGPGLALLTGRCSRREESKAPPTLPLAAPERPPASGKPAPPVALRAACPADSGLALRFTGGPKNSHWLPVCLPVAHHRKEGDGTQILDPNSRRVRAETRTPNSSLSKHFPRRFSWASPPQDFLTVQRDIWGDAFLSGSFQKIPRQGLHAAAGSSPWPACHVPQRTSHFMGAHVPPPPWGHRPRRAPRLPDPSGSAPRVEDGSWQPRLGKALRPAGSPRVES